MTLSTLSLQWNAASKPPRAATCGHICAVIDKLEVFLTLKHQAELAILEGIPINFLAMEYLIKLLFRYFPGVWHRAGCHSWRYKFPESGTC